MFLILAWNCLSDVLSWIGSQFWFPWQFPSLNTTFPNQQPKSSAYYNVSVVRAFFSSCIAVAEAKENLFKHWPLFHSQIFSVAKCCDIQGSHLIGYLWVSLIIDQPECLVCYFLCTELTLFCIELPENCIYLNQAELSNFFSCKLLCHKTSVHSPSLVFVFFAWNPVVFCSYCKCQWG